MGFGIYVGVLLLVGSIFDWRYRSLPVWLLIIGGVGSMAGILYMLLGEKRSIAEVVLALLPGVGAIFLAYATKEQIGYGDGALLLIVGGCLQVEQVLMILMAGLAGTCVISILLLLCKKANRTSRIPFVPFLTLGYMAVMLSGGWTG